MDEPLPADRRSSNRTDRRKHGRGGRRKRERRAKWQRLNWLFAAYVLYLAVRAIPATIRRVWGKSPS